MSLIAWYPLNGDIKNYGVGDMELNVSATPTFSNNGKIGKGLSNGGAATWTAAQTASILNNKELSICFWFKVTDASQRAMIFGTDNMSGANNRKFSIFQYPTANDLHLSWQNDETNQVFLGNSWTNFFPTNEWVHTVITYKNPNMKIYRNGTLYTSGTGISNSATFSYVTNVLYSNPGRIINDYRFYDHCLSPKEVELLSRGLVLHYPMNFPDGVVGGKNLGKIHLRHSEDTFDAATNTYTIHTPANQTYDSGAMFEDHAAIAKWGESLTVSMEVWSPVSAPFRCDTNNFEEGSTGVLSGNDNMTVSNYTANVTIPANTWTEVHWTVTNNLSKNNTHVPIYIQDAFSIETKDSPITWKLKNVQVVKGTEILTPFIPPNNETTIYDCSGYGNNAAVSAVPPTFDSNTPIGIGSYKFNGTNNFLAAGRGAMVTDEITVSWWGRMDNWGSYGRAISCTEGGGWNFEPNSSKMSFPLYAAGSYRICITTKTLASLTAGWHHFVGTYDGKESKIYIDGVLDSTTSFFTTKTPITYQSTNGIFVGAEAVANTTTPAGPYFNGNICDVRIYATALSAAAVADLYKTRFSVDNAGNFIGYNFKINSSNLVNDWIINQTSVSYGFGTRSVTLKANTQYTFTVNGYTTNADTEFAAYVYKPDWTWAIVLSTKSTTPTTLTTTFAPPSDGEYHITFYSYKASQTAGSKVHAEWVEVREKENTTAVSAAKTGVLQAKRMVERNSSASISSDTVQANNFIEA